MWVCFLAFFDLRPSSLLNRLFSVYPFLHGKNGQNKPENRQNWNMAKIAPKSDKGPYLGNVWTIKVVLEFWFGHSKCHFFWSENGHFWQKCQSLRPKKVVQAVKDVKDVFKQRKLFLLQCYICPPSVMVLFSMYPQPQCLIYDSPESTQRCQACCQQRSSQSSCRRWSWSPRCRLPQRRPTCWGTRNCW